MGLPLGTVYALAGKPPAHAGGWLQARLAVGAAAPVAAGTPAPVAAAPPAPAPEAAAASLPALVPAAAVAGARAPAAPATEARLPLLIWLAQISDKCRPFVDPLFRAGACEPGSLLRVQSQEQLCGLLGQPADKPGMPARLLWAKLDEARRNAAARPVPPPLLLTALLPLMRESRHGPALEEAECDDADMLCCVASEAELALMVTEPVAAAQLWAAIQRHKAAGAGGAGGGAGGEGAQQVLEALQELRHDVAGVGAAVGHVEAAVARSPAGTRE